MGGATGETLHAEVNLEALTLLGVFPLEQIGAILGSCILLSLNLWLHPMVLLQLSTCSLESSRNNGFGSDLVEQADSGTLSGVGFQHVQSITRIRIIL